MRLEVFIPGEVVPTARVRVHGGRPSTPRRTVAYQSKIGQAVRAAMKRNSWPEKHEGPVRVSVTLFSPNEDTDLDNISKSALDALVKAEALRDDRLRYVRRLEVAVDDTPANREIVGMLIVVWPIEPEGGCS